MALISRLLAAGCVSVACAASAPASVTVLGGPGGGPEETALRAVIDVYNKKADVPADDKVDVIFSARDGYYDKLQADLAAGSDAFDINLIATYSVGRYAPFMTPVELSDQAQATFGDTVLKTMQFDGKQYGVPTDLSLHFMFYRSDLIESLLKDPDAARTYAVISKKYLGKELTPKSPDQWTWEDYAATALYFTKAVNPKSPVRYGTILQMKNLLFNIMVFQSLPRAYGADWEDAEGKISVDSEAYRKGLELYKMLYDAGATPKDSLSYEFPEANAAFTSGQVAVMLQWNAANGTLADPKTAPNTAAVTRYVAPPAGPDGRFTHVHGLGFGLNSHARNPEGATLFLKWLSTEEAAVDYALAGGSPGLAGNAVKQVAEKRPDLVPLGEYASKYGYVMRGATSANALAIYALQAEQFTGYWGGTQSLDATLKATTEGMEKLLSK